MEPKILSANTYYWSPRGNASGRRQAEVQNQTAVADYFRSIGMDVEQNGDKVIGTCQFNGKAVEAIFEYSESCKNVYKSLSVTNGGKNSNITLIRKIAAAHASQGQPA